MAEIEPHEANLEHEKFSPSSCRVCMEQKEIMSPLFGPNTEEQLSDILTYCTGLKVTTGDGKPKQICQQCLDDLNAAYKFKKLCLTSDAVFENLLKTSVKTEAVQDEKFVKIEYDKGLPANEPKKKKTIQISMQVQNDHVPKTDTEYVPTSLFVPKIIKPVLEINPLNMDKPIKVVRKKTLATGTVYNIKDKDVANMIIKKISTDLINSENAAKIFKSTKPKVPKKYPRKKLVPVKKVVKCVSCDSCEFKCTLKRELEAHIKAEHPEQQKKYVCETCGKEYFNQPSIYYHMRTHKPATFKCKLCDYETHARDALRKHITVHTGEKKYKCEYCALAFSVSSNLKIHIRRAHLKDMPHKCHICDKAFVAPSYLKEHVESHMNVKNTSCDICDAKFAGRRYWKRHMLNQHNIAVPAVRSGRKREVDLTSNPP